MNSQSSTTTTTDRTDATSVCSDASTLLDGSVISTVPDRHGFLGGQQYSPEPKHKMSAEKILRRERKWLRMLDKWDLYMAKNYKKVRERCRKGIPMSVRPKAWLYLCGGKLFLDQHPDEYQHLIQLPGDPRWNDEIRKDLHRQFPFHEMFVSEDKPGQIELFNVLKAYSIKNPTVGYCQAQAPIAAFLLMHMPSVQAFWCLMSVTDRYIAGYYSPGLEVVQRDGDILHALLRKTCPSAHRHLVAKGVEPVLYMTEWFLCCFTRTLPWESLLRMWDIFLCEGVKILFKIALVIIAGCLGPAKARKRCPGMCETIQLLRNPPEQILSEEYLLVQMDRLGLTEQDFQLEHEKQLSRRKAKAAAAAAAASGTTSPTATVRSNASKR